MTRMGQHDPHPAASGGHPTSLHAMLARQARLRATHPAVMPIGVEGDAVTYQTLYDRALAAGAALSAAAPKDAVALIAMPTGMETVTAFLGAVLAGLSPAILPPPRGGSARHRAAADRIAAVATSLPAALICAMPEGVELLRAAGLRDGDTHRLMAVAAGFDRPGPVPWAPPPAGADTRACLQFTSGSMRTPRGVALSHGNILANMADIQTAFQSGPELRALGWLPLHHDMGLFGHLIQPLYAGGTAMLAPPEWFSRQPLDWLHAITRHGVTATGAPPFAWHLIGQALAQGDARGLDLSSLGVAHVGAEPVHPGPLLRALDVLTPLGFRRDGFLPCYGMAEATLYVASRRFDGQHGASLRYDPAAGTEIRIVDPDTGQPGEKGEIWISGPSVARGYHADASTAFVDADEKRWFRTGDIGRFGPEGLAVAGRLGNRIMHRGATHHAEDIEASLRAHLPALATGPLAAVAHAGPGGEGVAILAELRARQDEAEALRRGIIATLSDAHDLTPDRITFLAPGTLPRTTSGKLRRAEIGRLLHPAHASPPGPPQRDAAPHQPVAIIGMACRFPGADSPAAFFDQLVAGADLVGPIPPDRWDADAFYDPTPATPGKMNTRRGGFITDPGRFDPDFFGMSEAEAAETDPQQRLALEVSWRAIEDAGIPRDALAGSDTGVFLGISTTDYAHLQIRARPDLAAFSAWSGLGTAQSVAANRISFTHDLRGPSMSVDTACSSSMTALHLAVRALQGGDCGIALAGGVNLMLSPGTSVALAQFGMLSGDGRCKAFDEGADGYVRSEGCGFVVLKPLSTALADGDRVHAVIRATFAAQDGHSRGITAPNPEAQQALITATLARAGLTAADISYVEAHGTGTALGDPVELGALQRTYGAVRGTACRIGSVKANVGHLEAAAGIASLIKTVELLRNRVAPPQLHFNALPGSVDLRAGRLRIPRRPEMLRMPGDQPLRAAISSFGFGGALAHAIVEAAPVEQTAPDHDGAFLLPVSAQAGATLVRHARELADALSGRNAVADIARRLGAHRSHLAHRGFAVAANAAEAGRGLAAIIAPEHPAGLVRPGFIFSGQGAHRHGAGAALARRFPVFRAALDDAADALAMADDRAPALDDLLFGGDGALLRRIDLAQPALLALSHALDRLWRSFGITPAAVCGHSMGEISASLSAGSLGLTQAMNLAVIRGRAMARLPQPGGMIAVGLPADRMRGILADWGDPSLIVSAENGAFGCAVSGSERALTEAQGRLRKARIAARRLASPVAFHSPVLDPILDAFEAEAAAIVSEKPSITLVSTLTGAAVDTAPDAAHWRAQARQPVRFDAALTALREAGCTHLIEIGPGETLTAIAATAGTACLPSLPGGHEPHRLLEAVGRLYVAGADADWRAVEALSPDHARALRPAEGLPGQPFNRRLFWFDRPPEAEDDAPRHCRIAWRECPPTERADAAGDWLLIGGDAVDLATALTARGGRVMAMDADALPAIARQAVADPRLRIVVLAPLEIPVSQPVDDHQQRAGIGLIGDLVRELRDSGATARLHLVTRGGVATQGDPAPDPAQAAIWGLAATLFLEHPEWRGGIIDLPAGPGGAELLADALARSDAPGMLALRQGAFAPVLEPLVPAAHRMGLSRQGSYLITGGLGGLGLAAAHRLAMRGAGHLILLSRSADQEARTRHASEIAAIEAEGATVSLVACDTGDGDALRAAIRRIRDDHPALRGMIHAAGQNRLARIADTDSAAMLASLRLKAGAAQILDAETRDLPLDFFVVFSSVSALWGSVALGHYTAANRAADAVCAARRAAGLAAVSLAWGPWARVGMSAGARETGIVTAMGLPLIEHGAALDAMESAIAGDDAVRMVARLDWQRFRVFADFSLSPGLFADLRPADDATTALPDLPEGRTPGAIAALIERELAAITALPAGRRIAPDEPFSMLGLDSISAIRLVQRLEARTGLRLPATLAYTHPTIADASACIAAALRPDPAPAPWRPQRPATPMVMAAVPCAGASALMFQDWDRRLGGIGVMALEPRGRGARASEGPGACLADLAADLAGHLRDAGGAPVLFGHSFGARLAFETARHLAGTPAAPRLLILSCLGPNPPAPESRVLDGSDPGRLRRYASQWQPGIDDALWDTLLPVLADDLQLLADAGPADGPPLTLPVHVIGCRDDPLASPQDLLAWSALAGAGFGMTLLEGGHMPFRDDGYFQALGRIIRMLG